MHDDPLNPQDIAPSLTGTDLIPALVQRHQGPVLFRALPNPPTGPITRLPPPPLSPPGIHTHEADDTATASRHVSRIPIRADYLRHPKHRHPTPPPFPVAFPIRTVPDRFHAYLADMGPLVLRLYHRPARPHAIPAGGGACLGTVVIHRLHDLFFGPAAAGGPVLTHPKRTFQLPILATAVPSSASPRVVGWLQLVLHLAFPPARLGASPPTAPVAWTDATPTDATRTVNATQATEAIGKAHATPTTDATPKAHATQMDSTPDRAVRVTPSTRPFATPPVPTEEPVLASEPLFRSPTVSDASAASSCDTVRAETQDHTPLRPRDGDEEAVRVAPMQMDMPSTAFVNVLQSPEQPTLAPPTMDATAPSVSPIDAKKQGTLDRLNRRVRGVEAVAGPPGLTAPIPSRPPITLGPVLTAPQAKPATTVSDPGRRLGTLMHTATSLQQMIHHELDRLTDPVLHIPHLTTPARPLLDPLSDTDASHATSMLADASPSTSPSSLSDDDDDDHASHGDNGVVLDDIAGRRRSLLAKINETYRRPKALPPDAALPLKQNVMAYVLAHACLTLRLTVGPFRPEPRAGLASAACPWLVEYYLPMPREGPASSDDAFFPPERLPPQRLSRTKQWRLPLPPSMTPRALEAFLQDAGVVFRVLPDMAGPTSRCIGATTLFLRELVWTGAVDAHATSTVLTACDKRLPIYPMAPSDAADLLPIGHLAVTLEVHKTDGAASFVDTSPPVAHALPSTLPSSFHLTLQPVAAVPTPCPPDTFRPFYIQCRFPPTHANPGAIVRSGLDMSLDRWTCSIKNLPTFLIEGSDTLSFALELWQTAPGGDKDMLIAVRRAMLPFPSNGRYAGETLLYVIKEGDVGDLPFVHVSGAIAFRLSIQVMSDGPSIHAAHTDTSPVNEVSKPGPSVSPTPTEMKPLTSPMKLSSPQKVADGPPVPPKPIEIESSTSSMKPTSPQMVTNGPSRSPTPTEMKSLVGKSGISESTTSPRKPSSPQKEADPSHDGIYVSPPSPYPQTVSAPVLPIRFEALSLGGLEVPSDRDPVSALPSPSRRSHVRRRSSLLHRFQRRISRDKLPTQNDPARPRRPSVPFLERVMERKRGRAQNKGRRSRSGSDLLRRIDHPQEDTQVAHSPPIYLRPKLSRSKPEEEQAVQMTTIHITVERAMRLPMLSTDMALTEESRQPDTFVTVQWHARGLTVPSMTTNVIKKCTNPIWDSHHAVAQSLGPDDLAFLREHPPMFSIWYKSAGDAPDHLLGTAQVDLSALIFGLKEIHGWYHIIGKDGNPVGQVLLRILPVQPLNVSQQLKAGCYSTIGNDMRGSDILSTAIESATPSLADTLKTLSELQGTLKQKFFGREGETFADKVDAPIMSDCNQQSVISKPKQELKNALSGIQEKLSAESEQRWETMSSLASDSVDNFTQEYIRDQEEETRDRDLRETLASFAAESIDSIILDANVTKETIEAQEVDMNRRKTLASFVAESIENIIVEASTTKETIQTQEDDRNRRETLASFAADSIDNFIADANVTKEAIESQEKDRNRREILASFAAESIENIIIDASTTKETIQAQEEDRICRETLASFAAESIENIIVEASITKETIQTQEEERNRRESLTSFAADSIENILVDVVREVEEKQGQELLDQVSTFATDSIESLLVDVVHEIKVGKYERTTMAQSPSVPSQPNSAPSPDDRPTKIDDFTAYDMTASRSIDGLVDQINIHPLLESASAVDMDLCETEASRSIENIFEEVLGNSVTETKGAYTSEKKGAMALVTQRHKVSIESSTDEDDDASDTNFGSSPLPMTSRLKALKNKVDRSHLRLKALGGQGRPKME